MDSEGARNLMGLPVSGERFFCRSGQRRQAVDEKGARCWIRLEADRLLIGAARRVDLAQFRAKIGSGDPIGLEPGEPVLRPHLIQ